MTDFNTLIISITNRLNTIDNLVDSKSKSKTLPNLPDEIINNIIMMARPEKSPFIKKLENIPRGNIYFRGESKILRSVRLRRENRFNNIEKLYYFANLMKYNKKNELRGKINDFKNDNALFERGSVYNYGKLYTDDETFKYLMEKTPGFIQPFHKYHGLHTARNCYFALSKKKKTKLINDIISKTLKVFKHWNRSFSRRTEHFLKEYNY